MSLDAFKLQFTAHILLAFHRFVTQPVFQMALKVGPAGDVTGLVFAVVFLGVLDGDTVSPVRYAF